MTDMIWGFFADVFLNFHSLNFSLQENVVCSCTVYSKLRDDGRWFWSCFIHWALL